MKSFIEFNISLCLLLLFLSFQISAQWVQTAGLTSDQNTWVYSLAAKNDKLFAGTDKGLYVSTNKGMNWTRCDSLFPRTSVLALAVKDSFLFASAENFGVARSSDDGVNWTFFNKLRMNFLAVKDSFLFGAEWGIYVSRDNGESWEISSNGISEYPRPLSSIFISGNNLLAAGHPTGVYLSTDNGANWSYKGLYAQQVHSVGMVNQNIITGSYLSTDFGANWSQITAGSMLSFASYGNIAFAGIEDGDICASFDSGKNWKSIVSNLPYGADGRSLLIYDDFLFIGLDNKGVWKRPIKEIISSVDYKSSEKPGHFELNQNYPNPFNPETNISFKIPKESFVTLKIFDALGREVSTLVNEKLSAGSYDRKWSADGFAGGVYFYRLQAGANSETKKINLLK